VLIGGFFCYDAPILPLYTSDYAYYEGIMVEGGIEITFTYSLTVIPEPEMYTLHFVLGDEEVFQMEGVFFAGETVTLPALPIDFAVIDGFIFLGYSINGMLVGAQYTVVPADANEENEIVFYIVIEQDIIVTDEYIEISGVSFVKDGMGVGNTVHIGLKNNADLREVETINVAYSFYVWEDGEWWEDLSGSETFTADDVDRFGNITLENGMIGTFSVSIDFNVMLDEITAFQTEWYTAVALRQKPAPIN
jgi:hypothetical protein